MRFLWATDGVTWLDGYCVRAGASSRTCISWDREIRNLIVDVYCDYSEHETSEAGPRGKRHRGCPRQGRVIRVKSLAECRRITEQSEVEPRIIASVEKHWFLTDPVPLMEKWVKQRREEIEFLFNEIILLDLFHKVMT